VRCFGSITVDLTEQIERQDNPNKKVRGFRSAQNNEATTAVQGTLVLDDKKKSDR
jgi:2Fe-2S ferredoxin